MRLSQLTRIFLTVFKPFHYGKSTFTIQQVLCLVCVLPRYSFLQCEKGLDFVFLYDTLPVLMRTLDVSVSCFLGDWIAGKYGRKWSLRLGAALIIVGGIVNALAKNFDSKPFELPDIMSEVHPAHL